MKKLLYRKRYTTLSLLGILLLVGFGVWYNASVDTPAKAFMKKEPTWQTTNPVVAQDFASIKLTGKVKSNGFAIVAPRRVGIIQDLLVDIGDSVRKGETLGYLFPDGVEGQSSSSIAQASTQLAKARAELVNAQGVALDAVNFAQQGLRETQTKLSNLKDTSDASRNQLQQKHQEARTVATQVFENLKRLLFGSTNLNNSNRSILGDFSNRIQETKVENSVTEIERMEAAGLNGQEDIYDHLSHVTELLKEAEILYKSAKESRGSSMELIEKNLKAIQSDQIRVLKAQESLDDVILQVRELASTLDKSQESLNLVKSQQNLSITNLENAVEVALANYNAALVKAGHQRIVAPFDGVISGRMVEVGQGVTPNTVLFHMEGVPTARADQSLFEVHFAIPESWVGKVS
ncbi:MAG TPA: hypothetical protein VIT68_04015, partial [Candidatus Gracilibacteria bacterium]